MVEDLRRVQLRIVGGSDLENARGIFDQVHRSISKELSRHRRLADHYRTYGELHPYCVLACMNVLILEQSLNAVSVTLSRAEEEELSVRPKDWVYISVILDHLLSELFPVPEPEETER